MLTRRRCCCGDCLECTPCCIPKRDLVLSWNYPSPPLGIPATGTTTLVYDPAFPRWLSPCLPRGSVSYKYELACGGGPRSQVSLVGFAAPDCPGIGTGLVLSSVPDDFTCSPFHLHYVTTIVPVGDIWIDG